MDKEQTDILKRIAEALEYPPESTTELLERIAIALGTIAKELWLLRSVQEGKHAEDKRS